MNPERWRQIEELYHAALERKPEERAAYLDQAGAGDAELRKEVQTLLEHEGKLTNLLESPAMEVVARALAENGASLREGGKAARLAAGITVSHYVVSGKLGSGGMGEVYRARDTTLGRDVALKVLPELLAGDADRLARFRREAQMLAALNHPNIAVVYGFEESDKIRALAMELVEGATLAERISHVGAGVVPAQRGQPRGSPLPFDEALNIARQIAEGLEYAHEHGIIHRDLKPANIKVTPEGTVKILDFGLAKALGTLDSAPNLSNSPTAAEISTEAGVILGTAAYMSPEQAKGKPVDRRTDIWAFGCVLYEMLTGRKAFEGETASDTLAAVLRAEPNWDDLPATISPAVLNLLRRCLIKEPKRRLRDVGEARLLIEEIQSGDVGAGLALPSPENGTASRAPTKAVTWAAGIVLGAIMGGLVGWRFIRLQVPAGLPEVRFALTLPAGDQLGDLDFPILALSPDGSKLVYAARHGDVTELYLRLLDQIEAKPIAGTEDATCPFFSPDGEWIGFFADSKLKKISLKGGPPVTLCVAFYGYGASWGADGTIVYSDTPDHGLLKVASSGGTPQPLTAIDHRNGERVHLWPQILPGGEVLFNVGVGNSWDDSRIEVVSLKTGERRALVKGGSCPRYIEPGYILFTRETELMAVPFDLRSLQVTGAAVPVLNHVLLNTKSGAAQFTVSARGALAYVAGGARAFDKTLVWVDRQGKEEPLAAPPRPYDFPRLSPDGRRIALQIGDQVGDIWVYDISRQTLTRLTTNGNCRGPFWSPDGKRVAYSSTQGGGTMNIYWANADGSGEERLSISAWPEIVDSFSPDGRLLTYREVHFGTTGYDIWVLPLDGHRKPRPFLVTSFNESFSSFSPDGHWIAYLSDETGQGEVYLTPFPGSGDKIQVSTGGGGLMVWAHDGSELFYSHEGRLMEVKVTTQPTLKVGKPHIFLNGPYNWSFDIAPDNRKLLVLKNQPASAVSQVDVVLNWLENLKNAASAPDSP
jgi:Tol biopolymer transport system component